MITFVLIGILLIVLGWYIWQKQAIGLLSNFNESTTENKPGLAKWAGKWVMVMGIWSISIGIAMNYWNTDSAQIALPLIFVAGIVTMSLLYIVGGQKYLKR